MGDATMGNNQVYNEVSTVSNNFPSLSKSNHPLQIFVLETFPQIIAYDTEVFDWFKEQ